MKNLKKNKKGFTLIEMIVVIVIVAILAAISVPAVLKYIDEARDTKLIAKADGIKVTYQADLAKLVAKSTKGEIGVGDLDKAKTSAIASSGETGTIDITACDADIAEDAKTCTAVEEGKGKTVNDIKAYLIDFDGSIVGIPSSGAAYVTK